MSLDLSSSEEDYRDLRERYEILKKFPRTTSLDLPLNRKYKIASFEESLEPLILDNDVIVVAGAFFGDEGKGKLINAIGRHDKIKLIARVNSGENAGHTVYINGKKYVFHLIPSGLLIPDKINVIGPECVVDPVSLMKELRPLNESGLDYNLYVGNVFIVTPAHKIMDAFGKLENTSTIKGMAPAHSSKVARRGLRLDHLFGPIDLQIKRLERDLQSYFGMLHVTGVDEKEILERCHEINETNDNKIPEHVMNFLRTKDKTEYLISLFRKVVVDNPNFPERRDVQHMIHETLENNGKVLIEGSQGFFLSNAVDKHWSSATSTDVSAAGLMASAGYNVATYNTLVINVHKSPGSSRVGVGANPAGYVPQDYFSKRGIRRRDLEGICDDFDAIHKAFFNAVDNKGILRPKIYVDRDEKEYLVNVAMSIASCKQHSEFGATTNKPRITCLFDCVKQAHVNQRQGPWLNISALDRGDAYDKVGLIVGYMVYSPDGAIESNGIMYNTGDLILPGDPLPTDKVERHCYPIIRVLDGWKKNPIGGRTLMGELPQEVQTYLSAVEQYTGSRIIGFGNGTNSKDIVYVKQIET